MSMLRLWILLMPVLLVGCATHDAARTLAVVETREPAVANTPQTKAVETRYEVRGYRDRADPHVWHAPHTIVRVTRVPATTIADCDAVPRAAFVPESYAPLPASDELRAELDTQKRITAEIREMEAKMRGAEQRMQAQYSMLIRQTAELERMREQLVAERERVRNVHPAEAETAPATATSGKSSEVKW